MNAPPWETSARGFFLEKGSFSFTLMPSAYLAARCHVIVCWIELIWKSSQHVSLTFWACSMMMRSISMVSQGDDHYLIQRQVLSSLSISELKFPHSAFWLSQVIHAVLVKTLHEVVPDRVNALRSMLQFGICECAWVQVTWISSPDNDRKALSGHRQVCCFLMIAQIYLQRCQPTTQDLRRHLLVWLIKDFNKE